MAYPVYYVEAGDTLPHFFDTFDGGDGSSITMSGLAVTDIEIYKDGGTTQRSSDAGYTLLDTDGIDFDGITGVHGFSIDLSDNTDAGFYAVGSWYHVVVSSITVDAQTVSFVACAFRIVSATRGLAGTALPDAAADAAGGLPISDAGGLDLDAQIKTDIDALVTRLTAARAGYLDELGAANLPADIDTLIARLTAARAGYLDELASANLPADVDAILLDTGTTLPATLATLATAAAVGALNDLSSADVTAAVPTTAEIKTAIEAVGSHLALILEDTGTTLPATIATLATAAAIAALNDLSQAEANAACDTALADYDPPTRAEATSDKSEILADTAIIKADLPVKLTKNTAFSAFTFKMVDATDGYSAETGVSVTAQRNLDGSSFAACANSVTEIGGGWYKIDLAASDLNGDMVVLSFTGTGCRETAFQIITQAT
jgi:hypothetical protein